MSADGRAWDSPMSARTRDGTESLELKPGKVHELPGSDPRKVAMARAVHAPTAVPHGWTAEKLAGKSAANVSRHLRRLERGELKLTEEA